MAINFENIANSILPMAAFRFNWRFTDSKYDLLPVDHLEQLKPLNQAASNFLSSYIVNAGLHHDFPFKKDLFDDINEINVANAEGAAIKNWLYDLNIPSESQVFLSWDKETAMYVSWELFVQYFSSFCYPSSDDLTVFDETLQWALLYFHEDEFFFGKKKDIL